MTLLNHVKTKALSIRRPTPAKYADGTPFMVPPGNAEDEGKYSVNNGIIAFVSDYVKYVIPYSQNIKTILEENGFKEGNSFNVPFSNGETPSDSRILREWNNLLASS